MQATIDSSDVFYQVVNPSRFKVFISLLTGFALDVNITFTTNGFSVCHFTEEDDVALMICAGRKQEIERSGGRYIYNSAAPCRRMGIQVKRFNELLNTFSDKGSPIYVTMPKDRDVMRLSSHISSGSSSLAHTLEIRSMEVAEKKVRVPPTQYDSVCTVDAGSIKKTFRGLLPIKGPLTVWEVDEGGILRVSSQSKSGDATKTYVLGKCVHAPRLDGSPPIQGPVPLYKHSYFLSYLLIFGEAGKLQGFCNICLKDNHPLCFRYEVPTIGFITYYLVPKVTPLERDVVLSGASEPDSKKYKRG